MRPEREVWEKAVEVHDSEERKDRVDGRRTCRCGLPTRGQRLWYAVRVTPGVFTRHRLCGTPVVLKRCRGEREEGRLTRVAKWCNENGDRVVRDRESSPGRRQRPDPSGTRAGWASRDDGRWPVGTPACGTVRALLPRRRQGPLSWVVAVTLSFDPSPSTLTRGPSV